jgi:hypothetical protein
MNALDRTRDPARVLLALIRLFNGLAALLVPGVLARNVGVDPDTNPAILYVFRMFGIRTVLIALDLLAAPSERRSDAMKRAVWIHASDTAAAFLASMSPKFPKGGKVIVAISAVNTLLAFLANR